MCRDPNARVSEVWSNEGWALTFHRSLTLPENDSYNHLLQFLSSVQMSGLEDGVEWALDKSKTFTTKSLYSLTHRGVCVREADNIWRAKVPLKIKIFLWQIDNNRLQTAQSLKQKGWQGSPLCALCGKTETVDHIFFHCSIARLIWCGIRDCLGWAECPVSWATWKNKWAKGGLKNPKRFTIFLFAGIAWALWVNRNKMAIEKSFPKDPLQVLYSGISFLQKWRPLLKQADRDDMMKILEVLKSVMLLFVMFLVNWQPQYSL